MSKKRSLRVGPSDYLLDRLRRKGLDDNYDLRKHICMDRFVYNSPNGSGSGGKKKGGGAEPSVKCTSVRGQTAHSAILYDRPLIDLFNEGNVDEVTKKFLQARDKKKLANAQNKCGETLLMKVSRHVTNENFESLFSFLIDSGADPMVCCDQGKTLLHDLFWGGKPPPGSMLKRLKFAIGKLLMTFGRIPVLQLLTFKDRLGFTPLDYICTDSLRGWKSLVDFVLPVGERFSKRNAGEFNGKMVEGLTLSAIEKSIGKRERNYLSSLYSNKEYIILIADALASAEFPIVACSESFVAMYGHDYQFVLGRNLSFIQDSCSDDSNSGSSGSGSGSGSGSDSDWESQEERHMLEKCIEACIRNENAVIISPRNYHDFTLVPLFGPSGKECRYICAAHKGGDIGAMRTTTQNAVTAAIRVFPVTNIIVVIIV